MKASDLFTKALEAEGVEFIFAIPGEENLDLLESLRRSSIHVILNRHEQAADFMAATYGRLTGKTGVCMSTLGPGATNFVTAAAHLYPRDRVRRPVAEEKAVARAVSMIQDASRPLLLVGAGANRKRTSNMLVRFIDKTGIP